MERDEMRQLIIGGNEHEWICRGWVMWHWSGVRFYVNDFNASDEEQRKLIMAFKSSVNEYTGQLREWDILERKVIFREYRELVEFINQFWEWAESKKIAMEKYLTLSGRCNVIHSLYDDWFPQKSDFTDNVPFRIVERLVTFGEIKNRLRAISPLFTKHVDVRITCEIIENPSALECDADGDNTTD